MPLPKSFWDDSDCKITQLPDQEHPDTAPWRFHEFDQGGIHVVHPVHPSVAVCNTVSGPSIWTDKVTPCRDCLAYLTMVARKQGQLL